MNDCSLGFGIEFQSVLPDGSGYAIKAVLWRTADDGSHIAGADAVTPVAMVVSAGPQSSGSGAPVSVSGNFAVDAAVDANAATVTLTTADLGEAAYGLYTITVTYGLVVKTTLAYLSKTIPALSPQLPLSCSRACSRPASPFTASGISSASNWVDDFGGSYPESLVAGELFTFRLHTPLTPAGTTAVQCNLYHDGVLANEKLVTQDPSDASIWGTRSNAHYPISMVSGYAEFKARITQAGNMALYCENIQAVATMFGPFRVTPGKWLAFASP